MQIIVLVVVIIVPSLMRKINAKNVIQLVQHVLLIVLIVPHVLQVNMLPRKTNAMTAMIFAKLVFQVPQIGIVIAFLVKIIIIL